MTPEAVVRSLWDRIQARDWEGLSLLLDPHLVVRWPSTGEVFRGADNFVSVQSDYPEGWSISVLRVLAAGNEVVSEVEVPTIDGPTFRVASFATVRDGRVVEATEYWVTVDAEEPPKWREPYASRV